MQKRLKFIIKIPARNNKTRENYKLQKIIKFIAHVHINNDIYMQITSQFAFKSNNGFV